MRRSSGLSFLVRVRVQDLRARPRSRPRSFSVFMLLSPVRFQDPFRWLVEISSTLLLPTYVLTYVIYVHFRQARGGGGRRILTSGRMSCYVILLYCTEKFHSKAKTEIPTSIRTTTVSSIFPLCNVILRLLADKTALAALKEISLIQYGSVASKSTQHPGRCKPGGEYTPA